MAKNNNIEQIVDCDVLVVGGSGAGLAAAIEARGRGADVVVAAKGKAGRSGNTVVAGSQFCAVVPFPGGEDSVEQHFQDTLKGGKYVNDESLLRIFVERGGPAVLKLEEWGVTLARSDGELIRRRPPGHTYPRGIPTVIGSHPYTVGGLSVTIPMRETAERMGVRVLDETPVIRLALNDGEVWGAVAADLGGGGLLLIRARAVVVAAGGAGQLFSNTNNTRGISGDSYGLMLQAGAALRDMEFVQIYPTQMYRPFKLSVTTSLFGDGAVLRNSQGERFMPNYDPAGDRATRDVMSQAIFYEVEKGNGVDGGAYVDCTAVSEDVLQERYAQVARDLRKQGVDPSRDWLKVVPTVHFMMGGAVVDIRCFTGVPGLFAAGEAVGGVHGANRLSGNALSEIIVFGALAGESAAQYAGGRGSIPAIPVPEFAPEGGEKGEALDALKARLRAAMWDGASIVRSEESLRSALAVVVGCAEAAEGLGAGSVSEAALREEARLSCLAAEAIVRSALAREESRGSHFRQDFPAPDERWLGSNRVWLEGGDMRVRFVPKDTASSDSE
jgi:succinate dehydrogenase/fumarate reductase flavoprotein subunit